MSVRNHRLFTVLCFFTAMFWALQSTAQILQWGGVLSPEGGQVFAFLVDPDNPQTVYAGLGNGGIFKSEDSGVTWALMNQGLTRPLITSLALDPQDSQTLYAGTNGGGIFKSTDGAANWTRASDDLSTLNIVTLVIDPLDNAIMYAGTNSSGVFKSTDSGATWTASNTGLTDTDTQNILIDPNATQTLYVGTFSDGIFKSTDGGANWAAENNGLGATTGIQVIAFDPANSQTLYAATNGGVFKTLNGANRWNASGNGLPAVTMTAFAFDPTDTAIVYAASFGSGVFKSTDSGGNWATANNGIENATLFALATNPGDASVLYAGEFGEGVFRSNDSGASWAAANTGVTGFTASAVDIDPTDSQVVYAGFFGAGVFKTTDSGDNWQALTDLDDPEVFAVAIAPTATDTVYVGTLQTGIYKTEDGGTTWIRRSGNLNSTQEQSIGTIAVDPTDAQIAYAGTQAGVFRTVSGGITWSARTTGLTTLDTVSLAIDPDTPETLYASTNGGGVFKTTDSGVNWTAINNGLTNLSVASVKIDPANPQTVYAATDGGGIFKSTDGGTSWAAINNGLTELRLQSLAVNSNDSQNIYVGTAGAGVFESRDGGTNWLPVNVNLPQPFIFGLAVEPQNNTVYAGTVGGGLARAFPNQAPTIAGAGVQELAAVLEDAVDPAGDTVDNLFAVRFQDADGDAFAGVAIVGNAAPADNGTWEFSVDGGTTWALVDTPQDNTALVLSLAHLLRFVPAADFNDDAGNLSVRLWDGLDGSTAGDVTDITLQVGGNGAFSANTLELSATVLAVNDMPAFESAGDLSHFVGESNAQNISSWADSFVFGPANEIDQVVQAFNVTLVEDPEGILSDLPMLETNGDLSYTLTGNAGDATVEITLQDDGGTDNGGIDSSDPTRLKITVVDPDMDLSNLPLAVFQELSAAQLEAFSETAISTLAPSQWQSIPATSFSGLNQMQLGVLPLEVLSVVDADDVANFNTTEIQQTEDVALARFLTNVSTQNLTPADVERLLPDDWSIDLATGELTVPPGTQLTFRALELPSNLPENLTLPLEQPDLDSSFGLGGEGGPNLLDGLNSALEAIGLGDFSFSQDSEGVLTVSDMINTDNIALSFIPDTLQLTQISSPTNTIGLLPGEQFAPVTPDGKQIPLIPAPASLTELANLAGDGNQVSMGAGGDVLITGDDAVRLIVLFDAFQLPAGSVAPGINLNNPAQRMGTPLGSVVFGNGSAQQIFPYVPQPEVFRQTVTSTFAPFIESVITNVTDGTMTVRVDGTDLLLLPQNTTLVRELVDGETVLPGVVLNPDLTLDYNVQDGQEELLTNIAITP